jgi:tRNA dimethylallyltransferase
MAGFKVKPPYAIAIVGATASGKTAVSLDIASQLTCEIISADSRQIYQYLDIGTAKPTPDELNACKHHFTNILTPELPYSAGKFAEDARLIVDQLHTQNTLPLIVGGSGLYVRALCEGIFQEPVSADVTAIRMQLDERLANEGKDLLYEELQRIDTVSAEKYSDKNPRRIIRALEYYYATGTPFSEAHTLHSAPEIPFRTLYFGIEHPREILYERINRRCEEMWANGLLEETTKVLEMGYSPTLNSLNTVGYKEALKYISGEYSASEALSAMQQSTRNYAKRQLTWFRKINGIDWLHGSTSDIATQIIRRVTQLQSTDCAV